MEHCYLNFLGVSGVVVGHPFDTVKVRLQTHPGSSYSGMMNYFFKIIREESVGIFFVKIMYNVEILLSGRHLIFSCRYLVYIKDYLLL